MELKITRTASNRLYTEGYLSINDLKTTYTVESTIQMLPEGKYQIKLAGGSQRRRIIAILAEPIKGMPSVPNTLSRFEAGGSWISSKKNRSICIGQPIMPGALKKGSEPFERLFDRIEKAEKRGEKITLVIADKILTYGEPIKYWQEPANHGCPPSRRRVEKEADGSISVYDGNALIHFIPAEDVTPENQQRYE